MECKVPRITWLLVYARREKYAACVKRASYIPSTFIVSLSTVSGKIDSLVTGLL